MASHAWHPYAPDQEFGRQAARDEDLLDTMLRALDDDRAGVPRAANKASVQLPPAATRTPPPPRWWGTVEAGAP